MTLWNKVYLETSQNNLLSSLYELQQYFIGVFFALKTTKIVQLCKWTQAL